MCKCYIPKDVFVAGLLATVSLLALPQTSPFLLPVVLVILIWKYVNVLHKESMEAIESERESQKSKESSMSNRGIRVLYSPCMHVSDFFSDKEINASIFEKCTVCNKSAAISTWHSVVEKLH